MSQLRKETGSTVDEPAVPVLSEAEAERWMGLLASLKMALDARGISAALARRRRIVLRYDLSPCAPTAGTHGPAAADRQARRERHGTP